LSVSLQRGKTGKKDQKGKKGKASEIGRTKGRGIGDISLEVPKGKVLVKSNERKSRGGRKLSEWIQLGETSFPTIERLDLTTRTETVEGHRGSGNYKRWKKRLFLSETIGDRELEVDGPSEFATRNALPKKQSSVKRRFTPAGGE